MVLDFFDPTRIRSIAHLTQPRGCRPGKNAPKRRDRRVSTAVAHTICETRGRSPAPPPASRRRAGATDQVPWHHCSTPCCRTPVPTRIYLCLYARYAQPNQHMGASVWQRQRAGESKRRVIEPPWLQFTSECQPVRHPPRRNNQPFWMQVRGRATSGATAADRRRRTEQALQRYRGHACAACTGAGGDDGIIESLCLGKCMHSDSIPGEGGYGCGGR
jgi:hypothetical protein